MTNGGNWLHFKEVVTAVCRAAAAVQACRALWIFFWIEEVALMAPRQHLTQALCGGLASGPAVHDSHIYLLPVSRGDLTLKALTYFYIYPLTAGAAYIRVFIFY